MRASFSETPNNPILFLWHVRSFSKEDLITIARLSLLHVLSVWGLPFKQQQACLLQGSKSGRVKGLTVGKR